MNLDEIDKQMKEWLSNALYLENKRFEKYVKIDRQDDRILYTFYTEKEAFTIGCARPTVPGQEAYMSSYASSQLRLPGEDWGRGSDLSDGRFSKELFDSIMRRVMHYLLEPRNPSTIKGKSIAILLRNKKTEEFYYSTDYSAVDEILNLEAGGAGRIRQIINLKTGEKIDFEPGRPLRNPGPSLQDLEMYVGDQVKDYFKNLPLKELNILLFNPSEFIREMARDLIIEKDENF